jgi:hypothetical protein
MAIIFLAAMVILAVYMIDGEEATSPHSPMEVLPPLQQARPPMGGHSPAAQVRVHLWITSTTSIRVTKAV